MSKQNIQFQRGSNTAGDAVVAKQKAIAVASGSGPVFVGGANSTTPYLAWGQRLAILKKAKHPAAAKFFASWIMSTGVQSTLFYGMSPRTDLNTQKPWTIAKANSVKFQTWMEDRAYIERLKATLALYFGEVQGKPSPGELGLHPL